MPSKRKKINISLPFLVAWIELGMEIRAKILRLTQNFYLNIHKSAF